MAKGLTFDHEFLLMLYNGATATSDTTGILAVGTATAMFLSLHTADPTSAGTQTSSEISYTGYARIPVARTATGWVVTTNSVSPLASITFGLSSGGAGGTASFAMVGTSLAGTGKQLHSGALSPSIVVTSGVTPQLTTGSTITET